MLNERVLAKIDRIDGRVILELGAGNGYFAPMLLRRFSGQQPARLIISDQSQAQLDIAQTSFHISHADYMQLDAQDPFPLSDASVDLILAIMMLNELTTSGLQNALRECQRTLAPGGRLLAVTAHPAFVHALAKKGVLTDFGRGLSAMPSAEGLRLPVSRRSTQSYLDLLAEAGFVVSTEDMFADDKTLHEKPGLKLPRTTPVALLLDCQLASSRAG